MTPSKLRASPPEFVFWLMIANGSPQMLAIAAIKNIFEKPFKSFMNAPSLCPLIRSGECELGYGFSRRKTFRTGVTFLKLGTLYYGGSSDYGRRNWGRNRKLRAK